MCITYLDSEGSAGYVPGYEGVHGNSIRSMRTKVLVPEYEGISTGVCLSLN